MCIVARATITQYILVLILWHFVCYCFSINLYNIYGYFKLFHYICSKFLNVVSLDFGNVYHKINKLCVYMSNNHHCSCTYIYIVLFVLDIRIIAVYLVHMYMPLCQSNKVGLLFKSVLYSVFIIISIWKYYILILGYLFIISNQYNKK